MYTFTTKNKNFKVTNNALNTVARKNANCNLIGYVGCYDCMATYMIHACTYTNYNPIIIQ